jgi:hypothetical protein
MFYRKNYGGYSSYNRGYVPRQKKKHSGCKIKMMPDGSPVLSAWNYSKAAGLMSVYARPYKRTEKHVSQSGNEYLNLFVTLTFKDQKRVVHTSGLFNLNTKKLIIRDYSLVCNPLAPNGGYCGSFLK